MLQVGPLLALITRTMIKVKEYRNFSLWHEVNLDMYSGEDAIDLLNEKESYAREEAELWNNGKDYRLYVTRKRNDLIIRFLRRHQSCICDRWITQKIDHYKIV